MALAENLWSPLSLAIVSATFLLAGFSKGVVGLGLPSVSVALLAATLGLKEAVALMLVPALATNVWQALVGGALATLSRRLWTLLLAACVGTWIGVGLLARVDPAILTGILGILLMCHATYSLATPQVPSPGKQEAWMSPCFGFAAGLSTGLTGTFVVPGVLYLQSLGLSRDHLVQSMGVCFTLATIALAVSLTGHNLMTPDLAGLSAAALAPAAVGMWAGQHLRRRLPEALFRKVFFCALLLLGLYLAGRSFL